LTDVRGRVDGLEGAYVVGWTAPDESGVNRVVTICDEDGRRLASARAARFRADLVSLGLNTADFAFRIPILKPLDMKRLHVLSDGVELSGSPLEMGPDHVDSDVRVLDGCVDGWIIARGRNVSPPRVDIFDESGRQVGTSRTVISASDDPLFVPWRFRAVIDQSCFGRGEITLTCKAGTKVFAHVRADLRIEGTLEIVTPTRCVGWLMSPDAPRRRFLLDISRSGEPSIISSCSTDRHDVLEAFPQLQDAKVGFDITLPEPADVTDLCNLSIRLAGGERHLFQSPYVVGRLPALVRAARRAVGLVQEHADSLGEDTASILQVMLAGVVARQRCNRDGMYVAKRAPLSRSSMPSVTVVIPVYRDVSITRACIESVLAHRNETAHRILIVNDQSPHGRAMTDLLDKFARLPNVVLRTNATNLGFIHSVNRALHDEAFQGDALLLNSDTRVFAGWLDEMARVAYSSPLIGTVTALSNNATIFSYPHPVLREEPITDVTLEALASVALQRNAGIAIDVPTGHGFCLFIKRQVVHDVGVFDEAFGRGYGEENDFCARAADLGYRHVAAAGVLVEHRESVSFTGDKTELLQRNLKILEERYPEYSPTIIDFERRDGLRSARWALDGERLVEARRPGEAYALTIINWQIGGTSKAAVEIAAAAGLASLPNITVKVRTDGYIELTCPMPVVRAIFAACETSQLFSMLASIPIETLVVHQTLGYDDAFLEHLEQLARETGSVYYAHDFYPICPRVTMIDAIGSFCNVGTPEMCVRCVAMGGAHEASILPVAGVIDHRRRYERLLASFSLVVAPSQSAADYYRRAFPGITLDAIYHPETIDKMPTEPKRGSATDLVVLGAIGPHKGSRQLLELAKHARISSPELAFHVVGYTDIDDQLLAVGNVKITGPYAPEELRHLVAATNGRFALFLHTWPETYSYTLTEAVAAGLTPLVTDIGAPAERVRQTGFGHIFPFPVRAADVVRLVEEVADKSVPATLEAGPHRYEELSNTAAAVHEAIRVKAKRRNLEVVPGVRAKAGRASH
jgi:GT2 family glycosyltransferase